MKGIFKILSFLIISFALLTSCTPEEQDNHVEENVTSQGGWKANDVVYYRGDADLALTGITDELLYKTEVKLQPQGGSESDKLFIIGKYDSELSRLAYSKLERVSTNSELESSYVICTDGVSVAIAYENYVTRYAAIDYFLSNFSSLDLTKQGTLVSKTIGIEEYVNETRNELREKDFLGLSSLSAGAVRVLKELYSLYDEDAYIWLANLYDPDIGGFYYSNSGRNTQGFLPDLESTAQALMFMADSGMLDNYGGKYGDAVSPEMRKAILAFAKNSQDPDDGYFYHPQWGKSISSTRLGRDLGWATRIISAFGEKPIWDTPNGVGGEQGKPGSEVAMTSSLRAGSALPVSRIVLTAAPAYLKDVELFKEHLENDFDWENNSYRAGNAIESELGQIQNAGKEYTEALIEFLNSKQKSNGLWEDSINYDSVNGLMKISVAYTELKAEIPKADVAMNSALTMLKSDDSASHVCSVYNPWKAVANILESIKKVSGDSEVQKLRKSFIDEAEELIKVTLDKLMVFKKSDGGFSYYVKYSAANSQGSAVALEKTEESDVNATMICVNSIITAMFDVFGIEPVNRYYPVDYAFLTDTIMHLGTIIKDEIPDAEVITFDEYDPYMGNSEGGVEKSPDDYVENIVGDIEIDNSGYKWFESAVVKNPDPDAKKEDDKVLYAKSNVCIGEEKTVAEKPSSTRFKIGYADLAVLGNCFVYDADMYFVPGYGKVSSSGKPTSDPMLQIFFMTESLPQASLNFSVYTENGTDYVKIGENYAGLDGKESNIAGGIPMGKWVNIRLEYYKDYETVEENGKVTTLFKPALKIFVDGKFMGDCDATITGSDSSGKLNYYDRKVDQVSVSYYRYLASEVYFNNVLVERTRKEYVKGENPDAMIDPSLPDEEMRESYGFEDGLLNTSNVANKVRVLDFGVKKYINASEGQTYNPYISYSIVQDPKNAANKVLKVEALKDETFDKPSRTEVNLYNSAANGTDYIFESKFYYDSDSIGINGDLTQLFFMNSLEGQLYSLRISAQATKGVFKLSLIENNIGSDKDTGTGETICDNLACDGWFTLKIVFHRTGNADTTGADIYLNGELVKADRTFKAAALEQNPLVKVVLSHQKTNSSTVYLDDISFKKSGEVVEDVESDKPVADFTDGFNTKYLHSYSYSGNDLLEVTDIDPVKMETLCTKFYLYVDPKNDANQVLRAVNKNGGTTPGYTRVNISGDNTAGDKYTFETKMYIETFSAGYNLTQIKFVDKNGGAAFNTYISIDSSTKNLKIATTGSGISPAAGTNLLSGSEIKETSKAWFTLKMELYHKGVESSATNTYLKLYVNDILAYDGIAYGALGAEIDYVDIVHCKTTKSSAVLFDDISLTRSNVAYVKD